MSYVDIFFYKADRDVIITEILLNVVLNTITLTFITYTIMEYKIDMSLIWQR